MADFQSFHPGELSTSRFHGLLLGTVAPRPIAFASTIDRQGQVNLSPFSFFNVFSAKPPIAIFSPARRVRDNTEKHTLENVREVPEVVINCVNYSMVQQMSLSSSEYARGVNEFIKSGFTMLASEKVRPPRVLESPAQLECSVREIIPLGSEGGAGNLIVCEVLALHIASSLLDENGSVNQQKIDLVARMGGDWYARAHGGALFEVPKPLAVPGIGIDSLPEAIRRSKVLTGNHLGLLGNLKDLPGADEISAFLQDEKNKIITHKWADYEPDSVTLHEAAATLIDKGEFRSALILLMSKTQ